MRRPYPPRGFTLVELLISIAIALLLILGVNLIFKTASQTVGAGQSLLASGRDARTVFQTFLADLNNIDQVPWNGPTLPGALSGDAPFFIIQSSHVFAFRNAADQAGASSPTDPTKDVNLFPPTGTIPNTYVNSRSHRIDQLGFFARGLFPRQTSSDNNQFISMNAIGVPNSSSEAWVVIGLANQPNKAMLVNPSGSGAAYFGPGDPTTGNDFNFYSSDWMLSRMAMLLVANPTDPDYIADTGSGLSPLVGGVSTKANFVSPNAENTSATKSKSGKYTIDQSRLDIANTSIALINQTPASRTTGRTGGVYTYTPPNPTVVIDRHNYHNDWWDPLINYRFQASPFILQDPSVSTTATTPKISPYAIAKCSPNLIRGCSQFIIEYAGNYYTKNLSGASAYQGGADAFLHDGRTPPATPQAVPTPDQTGQLDFYIPPVRTSPPVTISGTSPRQIRWYGYPRRVNYSASTLGPTTPLDPNNGDVLPLRDVLASLNSSWAPMAATYADAERFTSGWPAASATIPAYPTVLTATSDQAPSTRYTYTAAWGPDVVNMPFPKMIRIIVGIDDHEGRMSQPQLYEFVFDVEQ